MNNFVNSRKIDRMEKLFETLYRFSPETTVPLTGSGSNRQYCRMQGRGVSCIGVRGTDPLENKAFLTIAAHFRKKGIPVPEVLAVSEDGMTYLQEDLGDVHLFGSSDPDLLCRTMSLLPKIQFEGADGLDFSICYPEPSFSMRTVMFDLNYFKYCFLKASGLEFNEIRLQDDFDKLASDLLSDGHPVGNTFMYRDFQSRNVMVRDGEPYFIDFQGGRRGPIHYDVASFVWHARSGYPKELREKMVQAYLEALSAYADIDAETFGSRLRIFVLFRLLQVLGAYGFRGLMEGKARFVESIPSALAELRDLVSEPFEEYPYLCGILRRLTELPSLSASSAGDGRLEVKVCSFSYKKGIPRDLTGNGGGYVFDCRSIHNPGRYAPYKKLTGRDEPVIRFLEDDGEIIRFLDHVYGVVEPHVETYSRRGFTSLMVSFGCTGGQHRSVYCAEHLAARLAEKYPDIIVRLTHREQGWSSVIPGKAGESES